ncbi:MAG: hypothetical protein IJU50_07045, partial [Lachnospiraceae bacterium]|nr:hypothetical protein [Lachnospiraceae bacterium]
MSRFENFHHFIHLAGDFMEKSVGDSLEGTSWQAPVYDGELQTKIWYRLPVEEGLCGDGSPYHV